MATTKIKFRASSVSGKQGTLFFQVIHQRVVRQVGTPYRLYPAEWDAARQSVAVPPDSLSSRSCYLRKVQESLQRDLSRLQLIILTLDQRHREYRAEEVVQRFFKKEPSNEFMAFAEILVGQKREEGHLSLATKYQCSLNSFSRFLGHRLLPFKELDASLILRYETFLQKRGLCPNTTSFYMRNLRAIYNQAVEQGLTEQRYPFARAYTGIAKTVKRAITVEEIQRIKSFELPPDSADDYSRDIFLFSFYTCGMSLIDVAHLKKSDIHDGYLLYSRQKTKQQVLIRWEKCMQQVVDKYKRDDSPYLLPLITGPGQDEAKQYRNRIHLINRHLKRLGEQIGLSSKLTTYVARHSWASIAKSQNVPVSAISAAMGHTNEKTTSIYLKSFGTTLVDRANRKVLSAIA
ncbi:MAG: tyrosine-type recombinase/integrase [Parabacteroides sp.]